MIREFVIRLAAAFLISASFHTGASVYARQHIDLQTDTWVATDALNRSLPTSTEVGPPRRDKTVGLFYFLWLGRHGDLGPFDITKIVAKDPKALSDPKNLLWGPELYPHHWGESIFGYYISDDDSVLRKHAQMITDAGVDMIVFDVTNQLTYPESWKALCRVFDQAKREGNRVPQIAFLCPFGDSKKVVHDLWNDLYSKNLYPDLWFRWDGKPLILADPAMIAGGLELGKRTDPVRLDPGHTLGQRLTIDHPFIAIGAPAPTWDHHDSAVTLSLHEIKNGRQLVASQRFESVQDNSTLLLELHSPAPPGTYELTLSKPKGIVGWWSGPPEPGTTAQALLDAKPVPGHRSIRIHSQNDTDEKIRRFFTFRKPQPDYFQGPTGPRQWSWLEVYPQHAFYKTPGVPEQVSVGIGQNAALGKLSVFTNPKAHGRSFHDGREPGALERDFSGKNFAEQWKRALEIDPPFVFITNWNEWIAGRFSTNNMPLSGAGPVTFVDEFDTEFSRDIEPMKGGHGDNYYYQMIANIRKYKGVRPISPVVARPIRIDDNFADWSTVQPEFLDTIGDPVHRDCRGWGQSLGYKNQTGRNDIIAAKVSIDETSIAFYARTRTDLTPSGQPGWMLLFIDADQNPKTGWLGYDFVVNRQQGKPGKAILERNQGGTYRWNSVAEIPIATTRNELELSIPRAVLGITKLPHVLDFKWADNIQQTGDWSDFTLNGDAAPNDRFNYRAIFQTDAP